jgi:DNA-binding NarL/FixJ family response regulator
VVRVFHCDDSAPFRVLVREMLSAHDDVEIVGEAADPASALDGVRSTQPDVVLLDLLDPAGSDELIGELTGAAPGARVVLYSGYPPHRKAAAHRAAHAYLQKSASFDELHDVILRAAG